MTARHSWLGCALLVHSSQGAPHFPPFLALSIYPQRFMPIHHFLHHNIRFIIAPASPNSQWINVLCSSAGHQDNYGYVFEMGSGEADLTPCLSMGLTPGHTMIIFTALNPQRSYVRQSVRFISHVLHWVRNNGQQCSLRSPSACQTLLYGFYIRFRSEWAREVPRYIITLILLLSTLEDRKLNNTLLPQSDDFKPRQ